MDFKSDLIQEVKTFYDNWEIKYTISSAPDTREVLIDFFNTNLKLIPQASRRVFKSGEVIKKSIGQPYINSLLYIENKFINGGDINPHLSKKILDPNFDDKLLSDWAIYHIHISDTITPGKKFYDRSSYLLFALISKDGAYFIDIRPHSEQLVFSKKELLEITQRNWPHIFEPLELKGVIGLTHNCNDDEIDKLRKAGVNTLNEINGKVYASIGQGYTSNGKSMQCVMAANNTIKWIDWIEKYINENMEEVKKKIHQETGVSVINPEFKLKVTSTPPHVVIIEQQSQAQLG